MPWPQEKYRTHAQADGNESTFSVCLLEESSYSSHFWLLQEKGFPVSTSAKSFLQATCWPAGVKFCRGAYLTLGKEPPFHVLLNKRCS